MLFFHIFAAFSAISGFAVRPTAIQFDRRLLNVIAVNNYTFIVVGGKMKPF